MKILKSEIIRARTTLVLYRFTVNFEINQRCWSSFALEKWEYSGRVRRWCLIFVFVFVSLGEEIAISRSFSVLLLTSIGKALEFRVMCESDDWLRRRLARQELQVQPVCDEVWKIALEAIYLFCRFLKLCYFDRWRQVRCTMDFWPANN